MTEHFDYFARKGFPMHRLFLFSVLLLLPGFAFAVPGMDVIYGDDDRQDVFESRSSMYVELSRSTAAMIRPSHLRAVLGQFDIKADSLEKRGICSSERFSHQTSAANCSGFLVSEKVLVTAGHCIKTMADCETFKWVFDYKAEDDTQKIVRVPSSSVYGCKKIIDRSLDSATQNDYAVIELDRKVTDRRPLNFRRSGKVAVNAPLVVIGHPSGLPTKIADGAKVRSLSAKFFTANLDTYGGNSGSAVFNADTGEVEGILVRGENDYEYSSERGCQVSYRCSDTGCRGEDVVFISNIAALNSI
jgi:V8-like Glu-specific endopeptidase